MKKQIRVEKQKIKQEKNEEKRQKKVGVPEDLTNRRKTHQQEIGENDNNRQSDAPSNGMFSFRSQNRVTNGYLLSYYLENNSHIIQVKT